MLATGRRPAELLEWTAWELELAHDGLPRHWGRLAYPMAQLTADFREMFMPRLLDPEAPKEAPKPRLPWTVEECLPPFAVSPVAGPRLSPELARLLLRHRAALPSWAEPLVDWNAVTRGSADE